MPATLTLTIKLADFEEFKALGDALETNHQRMKEIVDAIRNGKELDADELEAEFARLTARINIALVPFLDNRC